MRLTVLLATAAVIALVNLVQPARAAEPIVQAIDALQHVQAAVALGDVKALSSQPALLKRIGGMIAELDRQKQPSRRELSAVAIFLLSGGDPNRAAVLFRDASIKERAPSLFGALAYATGHQRDAIKYLKLNDPSAIPSLGAHRAYALSVLNTDENRKEALSLLDTARLMAPGTLIEEVALRREALLIAQDGDLQRLARLMQQYYMRFSRSPFAKEFTRALTAALVIRSQTDYALALSAAVDGSKRMAPEERTGFLLSITREIIMAGNFKAAAKAAETVRAVSVASSPESVARSQFYALVTKFLGSGEAGDQLEAFDPRYLPNKDRELFVASKALVVQAKVDADTPAPPGSPVEAAQPSEEIAPTAEAASRALALADRIVARQAP